MSEIDLPRLRRFLEIAGQDETNPNEAHNAVRMARKMLEQHGRGFADVQIHRSAPIMSPRPQVLSFTATERELEEAKAIKAALEKELADLRRDHISLQRKLEAVENTGRARLKTDDDGTASYADWVRFVIAKVGQPDRWRVAVIRQTKFTTLNIDRWAKDGKVPKEAVAIISSLEPVDDTEVPKNRASGGINGKKALLEALQAAHPEGIPSSALDTNTIRRATELRREGVIHMKDGLWVYGREPGWQPSIMEGEDTILELIAASPTGLSTKALCRMVTTIEPQRRLSHMKAAGLVQREALGAYTITELGKEALALYREKNA